MGLKLEIGIFQVTPQMQHNGVSLKYSLEKLRRNINTRQTNIKLWHHQLPTSLAGKLKTYREAQALCQLPQMGSRVGSPRSHPKVSEFIPNCEWKNEQDLLVLEVDLPGFNKDRLKVEYKECGSLKISGGRPGERWFSRVFLVPVKCAAGEIKAVYRRDRHVLRIAMPRKTSDSSPVDKNMPNPNPESNFPSQAEGEEEEGVAHKTSKRNWTKIAINVAAAAAVIAVIGVFTFFIICKAI